MPDESLAHAAAPAEIKSCCAGVYESDWAKLLLGESYHPGGLELTRQAGLRLGLTPAMHLLDAAAGRGASAIEVARMFGARVSGVDLSAANVAEATAAAVAAGVAHLATFRTGDAERIAAEGASFDAVLCECAFCLFPDKPAAAAEFRRVLRPGGAVAISDLTRSGPLPVELETLMGWIACIADARPVDEYAGYLHAAGFTNVTVETHDHALKELVKRVRLKLLSAEVMAKLGKIDLPAGGIQEAKQFAKAAESAVTAGRLGYALIVARIPSA